jgi:hypothetical protein
MSGKKLVQALEPEVAPLQAPHSQAPRVGAVRLLVFHLLMPVADNTGDTPPSSGALPHVNKFVSAAGLFSLSLVSMVEAVHPYFDRAVAT